MCLKNTLEKYGIGAKAFHWVIGLLMIGLVIAGLIMTDMDRSDLKWQIYGIHKALGIIVLGLAALRLIWRFINVQPARIAGHKDWERILSHGAHWALYATMFAMPLSGWAMSSAGGHAVTLFGLVTVPPLMGEDKELGKLFHEIHEYVGFALIGLIGLHVAGAIKHHIIDKDETLRRMLPFTK